MKNYFLSTRQHKSHTKGMCYWELFCPLPNEPELRCRFRICDGSPATLHSGIKGSILHFNGDGEAVFRDSSGKFCIFFVKDGDFGFTINSVEKVLAWKSITTVELKFDGPGKMCFSDSFGQFFELWVE